MTIDEMIGVLQAAKAGKTIQHQWGYSGKESKWIDIDTDNLAQNFVDYEYRVKPEPREFWVMIFSNGKNMGSNKDSKEEAEIYLREIQEENPDQFKDAYVAKVREVIDE